MNTQVIPSLETIVGLYRAAREQQQSSNVAMAHVLESASRYGYSEEQIARAAGLRIETRDRKSA